MLALRCPSLLTLLPLDTPGASVVRCGSLGSEYGRDGECASLSKVGVPLSLLEGLLFETSSIDPLNVWEFQDWKLGLYEDSVSGSAVG